MKTYKVEKYNLGDYEEYILESPDQEYLVKEVLRLSNEDKGRYSYRIETWDNGKMIGGWRFFQNGKEFTSRIIEAVTKGLKEKNRI